jgi:hypothetical protein
MRYACLQVQIVGTNMMSLASSRFERNLKCRCGAVKPVMYSTEDRK